MGHETQRLLLDVYKRSNSESMLVLADNYILLGLISLIMKPNFDRNYSGLIIKVLVHNKLKLTDMRTLDFLNIVISRMHESYNNEIMTVTIPEPDIISEGEYILTKKDILNLSNELREIAENMNDLNVCKVSKVNIEDIKN